jgi:2-keto-3-deoxy-L-rhamnonate aldolase RhmA
MTVKPPSMDSVTIQFGTFIKTASPHIIEILGTTSLHFGVIDAEHAPFDRATLDLLLLAGRAATFPLLVRIPDHAAATILSALDLGAAGLLVPHVDSARQAADVVAKAKFPPGLRGFSSSPRAAGYGTLGMKEAIRAGNDILIIAQIESAEAVDAVEEILAVDGINGVFVGRADLALTLGHDTTAHDDVRKATQKVLQAAVAAGKIAGMAVASRKEADAFAAEGADWFVVGSDLSLLRQAAQGIVPADNR